MSYCVNNMKNKPKIEKIEIVGEPTGEYNAVLKIIIDGLNEIIDVVNDGESNELEQKLLSDMRHYAIMEDWETYGKLKETLLLLRESNNHLNNDLPEERGFEEVDNELTMKTRKVGKRSFDNSKTASEFNIEKLLTDFMTAVLIFHQNKTEKNKADALRIKAELIKLYESK